MVDDEDSLVVTVEEVHARENLSQHHTQSAPRRDAGTRYGAPPNAPSTMKILFVVSSVLCVAATWFGLAAMVYYLDREESVREWLLAHLLYIAALVLLPFALFVVAVVVVGMCGVYIRREYIKAFLVLEALRELGALIITGALIAVTYQSLPMEVVLYALLFLVCAICIPGLPGAALGLCIYVESNPDEADEEGEEMDEWEVETGETQGEELE